MSCCSSLYRRSSADVLNLRFLSQHVVERLRETHLGALDFLSQRGNLGLVTSLRFLEASGVLTTSASK